ncbi:MAG: Rossmann-like and DUF2520 domain-containing protein [Acidobacteriota bacterium]
MSRNPPPESARGISIIGAGRAGGSMAELLARRGWPITALWSRRPARARNIARRIAAVSPSRPQCPAHSHLAADRGPIVLLAPPDGALPSVAAHLARHCTRLAHAAVLHLSGSLGPEVLSPLRLAGAHTGCLHPLAVFPPSAPHADLLVGAGFAINGDRPACQVARKLVRSLGGIPFQVSSPQRARYHLAASLVANDTVALFQLALDQAIRAGLTARQARNALAHLLLTAVRPLVKSPPERVLTGPVARGDSRTLGEHFSAAPGGVASRVHAELSLVLIKMMEQAGRLDRRSARRLARALPGSRKSR